MDASCHPQTTGQVVQQVEDPAGPRGPRTIDHRTIHCQQMACYGHNHIQPDYGSLEVKGSLKPGQVVKLLDKTLYLGAEIADISRAN